VVYNIGGKKFKDLADYGTAALIPAQDLVKIVPSDTEDLPDGTARSIWSGTAGTVNLVLGNGHEVTDFPVFPGRNEIANVVRVKLGGTANDLWAMY